ncbi:MAG: Fis family transcriptional regulator [Bdellovibrionales bacterium RIFCSPHIGHO2_01_FULL_40_29]|nr:MAG: Fis family transcriptional regulator [Bdellovibrionales bacterium RIFCSPHIGHO2_01_FULL_40_29]OFZ33936.1 MAG: Fis family transcriptional regulator [Bdellovibrionales bacterium RIFCSPHIGHO2_02_FULL_40_15]
MELHAQKNKIKILIIDDEAPIREVLSESLRDDGYEVLVAPDGPSGLQCLKDFRPDVCFLDIWMPKMDGIEVLTLAVPQFAETSFVMISGHGTIETAVKATKIGAWDFIEKPLSLDKVTLAIDHIVQLKSEKDEKNALLNKLRKSIALVGESEAMNKVRTQVTEFAKAVGSVLIQGEVGAGRELVAQNIHYMSSRASAPFSDINCSTLPQDLIEIELFGIEKGALPGIDKTRRGKIELIDGGTLLIQEIEEMPIVLQEKVVQFLKTNTFKRFGSSDTHQAETRLLLTASLRLEQLVKSGKIHPELEKLIQNLNMVVPPLRERPEDIHSLVVHFSDLAAKQMASLRKTISEQGIKLLVKHSWPGNVRELKNFIERVYILTPSDFVDVHDLRFAGLIDKRESAINSPVEVSDMSTFREARAEFEKEYLIKKIQENGGNISKTAEAIGLERSYLHRKIKAYGIEANI